MNSGVAVCQQDTLQKSKAMQGLKSRLSFSSGPPLGTAEKVTLNELSTLAVLTGFHISIFTHLESAGTVYSW